MHRALTLMRFALVPALFLPQSGADKSTQTVRPPSLSKPIDMGISDQTMFEDDPRKIKFRLVTSWIPGEKHQGMFRYKLDAWVEPSSKTEVSEQEAALLLRVSRCTITLELFDSDGFIIRRHPAPFTRGVDPEHARLHSLDANDAFQMDAQEYRDFIATGSWSVLWTCFTPSG